jgi:hypothetical protein
MNSETPGFFKTLRNGAIIIGAIAAALLSLPVAWPAWMVTFFTLIITFCSSIAGTSQLTTSDRELSKEMSE